MGDVAAAALAPEGFLAGALDGGGWLASQLATKNSTFVRVLDAACSPGPCVVGCIAPSPKCICRTH